MVKYEETFYGSHKLPNASCSEVKWKSRMLLLETKNTEKNEKAETRFY